jgi:TatD DNase family protein
MISLIDTHTHLHDKAFDGDRDAVVERAREAGVVAMVTLATDVATALEVLTLTDQIKEVFGCVGIHPSEAHAAKPGDVEKIGQYAQQSAKIVAIGEIGLDFYWEKQYYVEQYSIFREMLALAKRLNLPVVIHNRSAQREMQWFFQEEGIEQLHGVMHCFAGDVADARFYLDMGLHISFTASITHRNFDPQVAKFVPLDRVMLETDSPYIVPAGSKVKRNEPKNVLAVAKQLALFHNIELVELARITSENAMRFFNLPNTILDK